jgi:aspartate racemase
MIGILGGMGPAATADFYLKVIEETHASGDEDHVPLLIQSDPRIPHRPAAILSGGPSPLPALLESRDRLIAAGALALAMPCNTAHYWFEQLAQGCAVPFISIVDASCDELAKLVPPGNRIGLIATRGTVAGRVFDAFLEARGYLPLHCTDDELDSVVLPAIELVKVGRGQAAGRLLEPIVEALLARGAAAVILACTEVPMALDAVASPLRERCVDTNRALARACVRLWMQLAARRQGEAF